MSKLINEIIDILKKAFKYLKNHPSLFVLLLINLFFYWYLSRVKYDLSINDNYTVSEIDGGWYVEYRECDKDYDLHGGTSDCDYYPITENLGSQYEAFERLEIYEKRSEKEFEKHDFLKIAKYVHPTFLMVLIPVLSFIIWNKFFRVKKKDEIEGNPQF
jgi:hypothetical protein